MKLTILIVCFNEKLTIHQVIEQAKGINLDKEIIVIDNCSTDGTKDILEKLKYDKELRIVIHSNNMGVGYSAVEGIKLAKGDFLYSPCADLEYKMEDVYSMFEKIESENLDAVLGSRLLERKGTSKYRLVKARPYWLGTIIATFLVNMFFRKSFTDIIGTNLIKTSVLKSLGCKANNQAFAFELVSKLCKKGYKIGEIPIWYKPRTHKDGKTIKVLDMVPAIVAILKVKFFN
jgi:dolichol-phosphate mannosyltransferase